MAENHWSRAEDSQDLWWELPSSHDSISFLDRCQEVKRNPRPVGHLYSICLPQYAVSDVCQNAFVAPEFRLQLEKESELKKSSVVQWNKPEF